MSNFKLVYLKDVADSQTGPFGSQLHQSDYVSEGTPIVTVEHLGIERFTHQNLPFVSDNDRDRLSKYMLKEGDIVFSRVGSVDRCTYVTKEEDGWMFSGRCIRVRTNDNANGRYLNFYFRQDSFKKMMLDISVGATMPSLNTKLMDNIPLRLPHIQTQQKIAKILSSLDAKIELNNKINDNLEQMAKTLYDYWFVQFDFPDTNGMPYKTSGGKLVWDDELKREIPNSWKSGELKDLFYLNPTLSLKKGAISSYIDMNALPTEGFMTKAVQKKEFTGGVKFQNEDVIVARITPCLENGKTGLITLLEDNEIGFGSTEFIVLRGKNVSLSCFGALLSRSELFRKYAIANMLGTSGRKRVEASKIGAFPIALPNESILEKFEKIISTQFKLVTINTKENQKLSLLRDWLLPMLMNGQITVKD